MSSYHQPVLLEEVISFLNPKPDENFIDCTLGGGGHTQVILEKNGKGKVLGIDLDLDAIEFASKKLQKFGSRVILAQNNFANLKNIIKEYNFTDISGILIDLGVSSHQLSEARRGFSYRREGILDMRLGESVDTNAKDLLEDIDEGELMKILSNYGEVRSAAKYANKIIQYRKKNIIETTKDLKDAVLGDIEINSSNVKLISRIFQALRIAVNRELENINNVLFQAIDALLPGGRLVVISYHSLEDRIVKKLFQKEARDCVCPDDAIQCECEHKKNIKIITKKPVIPTKDEINKNKKSRSAKLRAIIKI